MIPITVERLRELYAGVAKRSLRLETRQTYAVPWEDEDMAAWRRANPSRRGLDCLSTTRERGRSSTAVDARRGFGSLNSP